MKVLLFVALLSALNIARCLAADVPSCPAPGGTEVILYPKPDNCSQYYECDNGNAVVMDCPPGLEFNAANTTCDYSYSANCEVETRMVVVVRSVAEDTITCPAPGSTEAVLYPKPDNCSQYYECDNGNPVVMDCPTGLEFNAANSTCDYSWSANCQEETSLVAVVKARSADEPTCALPGQGDIQLFAKPDNCSQYYECDNGKLLTMNCPPGLEFNAANKTCDYSWSANCQEESRLLVLPQTRDSSLPDCPNPGTGEMLIFAKPDNCSQYYECDNGQLLTMNCPTGLEFNAVNKSCDYSWSANCQVETRLILVVRSIDADQLDLPTCNASGDDQLVLFPKPDNCSQYYECDNGKLLTMDCPDGLEFNAANTTCDYPYSANCEEQSESLAVLKSRAADQPTCSLPGQTSEIELFPKPDNCSQYYECANGQLLVMDCPPGLEYNAANTTCDYTWSANCQVETRAMTLVIKHASLPISLRSELLLDFEDVETKWRN